MGDTIKIGSLDVSAFKVGSSDCKIYLGTTQLYPQGTPPTPPVFDGKLYATYNDSTTYELPCDGNSTLTLTDTQGHTTAYYYMTSAEIGGCITSIGDMAFSGCTILSSVTIPNSVTSIGATAFFRCSGLTSITIPSGVTSIGNSAFNDCSNLTSITIPSGVTSIGNSVFGYCASLSSITIPNSVTSIGNWVFSSCVSLSSITIPNSVTSIGEFAFYSCRDLTSIDIPSGVTSISNSVFGWCPSLSSITIPSGVTSIGDMAFLACSGLTSITVEATTPPTLLGSDNFASTNDCPIYVPCESFNAYTRASGWFEYADRLRPIAVDERWTATTSTICVNGDKYAIDAYEYTCDGINWVTTDITRQGSLIESASTDCQATSHIFSAPQLFADNGAQTETSFTYDNLTVSGSSDLKITGSTSSQTLGRLSGAAMTNISCSASDGTQLNSVTVVCYNTNTRSALTAHVDSTFATDYTMTSGTCTYGTSTRYWVRYEIIEGHTPTTQFSVSNWGRAWQLSFIAFNVESTWVDNLPIPT